VAPDPALTAQALVLVQAQAATREQISAATQASVAATLQAFLARHGGAGFSDHAAVTRLAKNLATTTRAGQRQTSISAAAYWSRIVQLLAGRRPASARLIDVAAVRPVPVDAVYGRLADQYRWLASSRGPDTTAEDRLRSAVEATTRRIARQASTLDRPGLGVVHGGVVTAHLGRPGEDISPAELARRIDELIARHPTPTVPPDPLVDGDIADRVLHRAAGLADSILSETMRAQLEAAAKSDPSSVTGYRRVPHPELGSVCGLCLSVSTRIFHRGNLLPLHPACRCTVTPIVGMHGGDGDVGGAINDADLQAIYDQAGGTTAGRALATTRWRVVAHPERGVILLPQDGSTVTLLSRSAPAKAGAKAPTTRPQVDPAVVAQVAEKQIADLERRAAAGEDVAAPLRWQIGLLDRMRSAA
jgi:hypothetical protein